MFSKDEELKRVSDAYHRLVISEGNYETPGLKETLENEEYYKTLKENCKNEKDNILSVETYAEILVKEYENLVAR